MDGTAGAPFGLQYRAWRCRQLLWRDRTSIRVIALALLCCAWRLASPTCDLGPAAVASQHAAEAARAQREFWLASYVVRAAAAADAAANVHAAASPSQCPATTCQHWPWEWRITCGCWPAGSLKPGGWASGAQRLLGAIARRVLQVVVGPFTLGAALGSLLTLGAMVSIVPYLLLLCVPLPAIQRRSISGGHTPGLWLQLVWRPRGWYWLVPGVREGGTAVYRLLLSALQLASMGRYRGHELMFSMFPCGQWRHMQYVFKSWHAVLQVLPPRLQLACCMVEWVLTLALVAALEPGLLSLKPAAAGAACGGWLPCILAAPFVQHLTSSLVLVVVVPVAAAWVLEQGMRSRWRAVCAANAPPVVSRPGCSSKQKGRTSSEAGSTRTSTDLQRSPAGQESLAGASANPMACYGSVTSSGTGQATSSRSSLQLPDATTVPNHLAGGAADALVATHGSPQQQQQPRPAPVEQQVAGSQQDTPPQGLVERLNALLGPAAASAIIAAWEVPAEGDIDPAVYVPSSVLLPVGIKVDTTHSRVDELEPALLGALQGALQAASAPPSLQQEQASTTPPQVALMAPQRDPGQSSTQQATGESYALQAVCFPGCVHLLGCVYTPSGAWQQQLAVSSALQATLVAQVQQGLKAACDSGGLPPIAAVVGTAAAAAAAGATTSSSASPLSSSSHTVGERSGTGVHSKLAAASTTLAIDVCCMDPPVCAAQQTGQQWITLHLNLSGSGSAPTAVDARSHGVGNCGPTRTHTSSSSGSQGTLEACRCRLLVFSQQQVAVDQVMLLAPVLRFPLPPLSPGVYHLAILPAAAAATAGGATCEAADAGASSSRFEGWDPSSAAPWVLQPLLALPAPAARELQQHWQRLCRAAGASSPQHYQSGSSGSEQSSSQGQGCGAGTGAPHVAAQAKVWRSIWAGLMHDMACAICNTPPTAQPHPHAALVHLRPASPAVPGAGAAGHTDSVPPPASPLQQHQHHQQEQNQLLVKTLRVLLPYLTQVGLAATARHLVEQLAHNSWGMSTNTPPGPSVMAAFTRNTTSTSK